MIRRSIHDEVCEKGYDEKLTTFVQSYGSKELDASLLLMPLVGFLPAHDQRVISTVRQIERHLIVDGFVMRYDPSSGVDGQPGGEGAFLSCSFWYADNLIQAGRTAQARELFERLLSLRNDLGLLTEEYDMRTGRLVGNFPQALSHIALVNTAHNLDMAGKPVRQRQ